METIPMMNIEMATAHRTTTCPAWCTTNHHDAGHVGEPASRPATTHTSTRISWSATWPGCYAEITRVDGSDGHAGISEIHVTADHVALDGLNTISASEADSLGDVLKVLAAVLNHADGR
jgi:hypothetical protein